jgi:hypothetical protein
MLRILASAAVLASAAAGAGWPCAGGNPMHNGLGDVSGPDEAELLWQGTTETTLFGCQIYVWREYMANMRFQSADVSPTVLYDLTDGEELWTLELPGDDSRTLPIGFRDSLLYVVNYQESSAGDTVCAYDPVDTVLVWQAEDRARFGIAHMATFAGDGDLILPANGYIYRIDREDGSTVWKTDRPIPNTGAGSLCRVGGRVYGFEGYINTSKRLVAYDAGTGEKLYESDPIPGDSDQEIPLMADGSGNVYVIRDGTGEITALADTGSGFEQLWTAPTATGAVGTGSTGNFGAGPDGSLYFVSSGGHTLVRRDPSSGAVLDESPYLAWEIDPRVTVGQDGTVYVATGTGSDGKLYAMTADLQVLWEEGFNSCYYSGPALGYPGYLAMCGNGTRLRVYSTNTGVEGRGDAGALRVRPNPASASVTVSGAGGPAVLYDLSGRAVMEVAPPPDGSPLTADVSGLPPGVYCVRCGSGAGGRAATLVVAR